MSRLRISYIGSLVILALLIVFTVFRPMATGGQYSEVQRESLLQTEDGWILQFDIMNREGREQNYTIHCLINNGTPYKENILLRDGKTFTFIRRIHSSELEGDKGKATFAVYKEGDATPVEQATYHLK